MRLAVLVRALSTFVFIIGFALAETSPLPTSTDLPTACTNSKGFVNGCSYNCTFSVKGDFLEEDHMACDFGANTSTSAQFVESFRDPVLLPFPPLSNGFWRDLAIIGICVTVLGIVSALHIGLSTLDPLYSTDLFVLVLHSYLVSQFLFLRTLKILKEGGASNERAYASVVLPIIERHHWLLVSLVVVTAFALESLPLVMERLIDPYVAFAISVTAVMVIGELIPQALGAKHALKAGYYLSWLVWLLMIVTGILSYPLGLLLDCLLGADHGTQRFRRNELKELVKLHGSEAIANGSGALDSGAGLGLGSNDSNSRETGDALTTEEVSIIRGALSLREKTLTDKVYTPIDKLFAIEVNSVLDERLRTEIDKTGHSRIPVYRRNKGHILGLIHAKKLLAAPIGSEVQTFDLIQMPRVSAETTLFQLLNLFRVGGHRKFTHMAIVTDPTDNVSVLGAVTLEDVIDELLEYDEPQTISLPQEQVIHPETKEAIIEIEKLPTVLPAPTSPRAVLKREPSAKVLTTAFSPVAKFAGVKRAASHPHIFVNSSAPTSPDYARKEEHDPLLPKKK